jgi:hypothetical protein
MKFSKVILFISVFCVVDALFEDGCLLQGVGKKQQSVCIHNEKLGKEKVHGDN